MLDHLDVAQRRYEEIRPTSAKPSDLRGQVPFFPSEPGKELSLWVEKDVCRVVEKLLTNPRFRAQVSWPIRQLPAGSRTPERALVETVDSNLVACARALAEIARHPNVMTELLKLEDIGDPAAPQRPGAAASLGLKTMEFIGGHPWRDLVSVFDFYQPVADLNFLDRNNHFGDDGKRVQLAAFVPFCNPDLQTLGDFISRMLMLRIEHWENLLSRFQCHLLRILRDGKLESNSHWKSFGKSWEKFRQNKEQLKATCLIGKEAMARNSCIALFQAYAEYRPLEKIEWLNLPPELRRNGQTIRYKLEERKEISVAGQIAAALVDVETICREEADLESMIAEKCESLLLVVVSGVGRREVYWKKELLFVDWDSQNGPWTLLSSLAECAKLKQGTDNTHVKGSLKDFRARLKHVIPPDLDERIRSAGQGTYRLHLDPEEIGSFHIIEDERLEEVIPSKRNRARP